MCALTLKNGPWPLIVLAAVIYVITCVHMAAQMRRIGRNPITWFFLSLFFTAIPGAAVLLYHNFAWMCRRGAAAKSAQADDGCDAPPPRCPHCGELIGPEELTDSGGVTTCPRCRQVIDETGLA